MTTTKAKLPLELQVQIRYAAESLKDEFIGIFATETIERFLSESVAALEGARVKDFVPLFAHRFARQRLKALARVEGHTTDNLPSILFLCVHNAGRSQMAAGFAIAMSGGQVDVFSGGSDPTSEVNPAAIAAMDEIGIDIANQFPKPWTNEIVRAADVIITMGCGDACPVYPGKRYEDWELDDPSGLDMDGVRPIRDQIEQRVRELLESIDIRPVR